MVDGGLSLYRPNPLILTPGNGERGKGEAKECGSYGLASIEERDGVLHAVAEMQALRLNDAALVGVSAEPFVEVGLQVKARSGARVTVFAGYTNGSVGYLPVPAAHEQGGYKVNSSHVYYCLPAPLSPDCAGTVIDTAVDLIDELARDALQTAEADSARARDPFLTGGDERRGVG